MRKKGEGRFRWAGFGGLTVHCIIKALACTLRKGKGGWAGRVGEGSRWNEPAFEGI